MSGIPPEATQRSRTAPRQVVVSVLWAPVRDLDPVVPQVLTRAEIGAALRTADPALRAAQLAGRALTQLVLTSALDHCGDEVPRLVRACEHCGGPHGRPRLPGGDVAANLSRAGQTVAVALAVADGQEAPAGAPGPTHPAPAVGLDVVDLDTGRVPNPADVLHPAERARHRGGGRVSRADLLQTWARKEAVLKASGHGLAMDPVSLDLGVPPRAPGAWGQVPSGGWAGYRYADLAADGWCGAVALGPWSSPVGVVQVSRWTP